MLKSRPFDVSISGMHSINIPEELVMPFLERGHKRVKVVAAHEGKSLSFHAAIQKWKGRYALTFGKRNQKALGVFPNDYFSIQLFEDQSKYGVEPAEELEAVLSSDPEASAIFEGFTDGKKRSVIYMIGRYTVSQTRIDKSLLLCANLKKGVRKTVELLRP